jgi:ribonuclease HII
MELLKRFYNENNNDNIYEIGVDEVGRGPLFGRVYCASVIMPINNVDKNGKSYDFSKIKDSKKFTSKKKINEVADYIKENALYWDVSYCDENIIDEINILQATQLTMHKSINNIIKLSNINNSKSIDNEDISENIILDLSNSNILSNYKSHKYFILVDGNYFNPITYLNKNNNKIENIPYTTIEGGDNKYISIAAASILAKVERDKYINDLCNENPDLIEKYGINTNKGYGTKKHIDGIKKYGITKWHRKSFSPCKNYII